MNADLTEASEACSTLDVALVSVFFWVSLDLPWSNSGRRFTTVSYFLYLCIMALTVAHWCPKALEQVFQCFPVE